jgi:hypothetical protein
MQFSPRKWNLVKPDKMHFSPTIMYKPYFTNYVINKLCIAGLIQNIVKRIEIQVNVTLM